MTLNEFGNQYINFALYSNIRAIASYIDGFKNSNRKVIYTIKDINTKIKVNNLASMVSLKTEYLHGETSLQDVISNLAKSFTGSNNYPLLEGIGNFGTRFNHQASSPRYVSVKKSDFFDKIFDKTDYPLLKNLKLEGKDIEYQYFMPTLPLLLINGSNGISVGYKQNILPRDIKDIINYLINKNKNINVVFNNYKGEIITNNNTKEVIIKGVYEIKNKTLDIYEIPINFDYKTYIDLLDKLKEKKIITSYKDFCSDNEFRFKIRLKNTLSNEEIESYFKLSLRIRENYISLDENNKLVNFNNVYELIDKWYEFRLNFLRRKKEYYLKDYLNKIDKLKHKINIINKLKEDFNNIKNINDKDLDDINLKNIKNNKYEKELKNYIKRYNSLKRYDEVKLFKLSIKPFLSQ